MFLKNNICKNSFPKFKVQPNISLREQVVADNKAFFEYYTNPLVSKYILSTIPINLEKAKQELKHWIDIYYCKQGIFWAINCHKKNKMIGAIGLFNWDKKKHKIEISYDLHPDYWNKGIITQAINIVKNYAVTKMSVKRIEAFALKQNFASNKVLLNCDFQHEITLKSYKLYKEKFYDIELFSFIAT